MGDFFTAPPGYPEVSNDPGTPPPDFKQVGANIGIGLTTSGATGSWWNGFVDAFVTACTKVLGFVLAKLLELVAFVVGIIGDVSSDASVSYGKIVAATLHELFGVTVDPASVNTRVSGPGRQAAASALGQAIIGTMFSGVQKNPAGGVVPSDAAANQFLAVTMNMELNGWIESWFVDGVTGHLLEKYGDLKDGIARVLGLGRMSRQVFAPPLKVLVHDPYLALLNQKYRPKQQDAAAVIRAHFRGEVDTNYLSTVLGNEGYSEQEIAMLLADHGKYLPNEDVDYLLSRGLWSNDDAVRYITQQGYDTVSAGHLLQVLADKRIQKYEVAIANEAIAAFVRGDLDAGTCQDAINNSGVANDEKPFLWTLAQLKRSLHIRHLSLGEIQQGIKDGILNLNDLSTWGQREGMPADELAYLELITLFQVNKQSATAAAKAAAANAKATAAKAKSDAAATKAAQAKALAADKGVSVAQAESLVQDGHWTFNHLTAFLTAKGYGADAIDAIEHLLQEKIAATDAKAGTAATVRATATAKGLSLAMAEKATVAGILTIGELQQFLTAHGFDTADAQVIVDLTQDAIAAAKVKADAKAAATAKAKEKGISLQDLERAARLGLTTTAAYNAALQAAGFDAGSITLLDSLLAAQIASDRAAAAKKGTIAAASGPKGASLAQVEQEVVAGIRPIGDYTAELVAIGFAPADQVQLTELLQLRVDQAKDTVAQRAAAAKALTARGISLSQAETAVKLNVVPIATYRAMLKAAGYTQAAIDVLSNSLLAQLAAARKTQTAANAAGTALAGKGISLPQLEQAVIKGLQPIAAYTTALTNAGYAAADAGTLTDLLQLKVDQANFAAGRHADAEGLATLKGISLAAEEQAVLKGNKTMANYDALLSALGYDAIDRATLTDLLQAKVTAAAAKAGGGSAAPTPAPPAAGG